jgi:pimeloyl-ACP methyl ester carboxylesterase
MVRGFEVLPTWSSVDRLSSISAPTLLIVGREDVFTAWPQSLRIASRIPNAEVVILEAAGHFPWIEVPDAFWGALEGWLR